MRPYVYASSSLENAQLQAALKTFGFDPGPADGELGPQTRDAVIAAQKHFALVADGVVRDDLLVALGLKTAAPANPITDFFTELAIQAALNRLKGLPLMNFLSGYKTYIVGAACILTGAIAMLGWAQPPLPALDAGQGWQLVLTGLGFLGLRAALPPKA